jgi:hypothetical protein
VAFQLCGTSCKAFDANRCPHCRDPTAVGLPPLDSISARLISPRLPFIQIRRLRYEGNYGIVGQVINVPVDVNTMERCLFQALMQFSDSIKTIIPDYEPDTEVPIVLTGDFNIDVQGGQSLLEIMKREFRLEYVPTTPTTLGNTTTDLTFVRNINVFIMPFVSYFSYHRPLLNKTVIDY